MANNRMWLACGPCVASAGTPRRFLLAKYYPSTGWYGYVPGPAVTFNTREELEAPEAIERMLPGTKEAAARWEELDAWLEAHRLCGETAIRLEYESP